MFESDLVDFFSRIPAWVVPALWLPVVAALAGWSRFGLDVSWPAIALQGFSGYVTWTLMEYWLHRTLFHWVPDAPWGGQFHFFVHGVHHQWFQDKYRLVMPPAVSLSLAVIVFSLLYGIGWVLGAVVSPTWVYSVFAGIVLGYTIYDCTHYHIHHHKPMTAIGRALRAHHNKHHHNPKYAEKKFGVSITIWDHVFGTYE